MRRWTVFLLALAASVGLTALLWNLGLPGFFLLLLFPILLWPRRSPPDRVCPSCGFTTLHPAVRYCPHDGTRLEVGAHRSTRAPESSRAPRDRNHP